jgi:hypothetical protein
MKTITEGLAELKTLTARIQKKREFVLGCLGRQEAFKDPHEKDGGSKTVIARERQAITDLEARTVAIRSAIQGANRETELVVNGLTMTIHDWLVWRREVAPGQKQFLANLRGTVEKIRSNAQSKGFQINPAADAKPQDVIINVDEYELAKQAEALEDLLGTLDGLLSLKNATITIDI